MSLRWLLSRLPLLIKVHLERGLVFSTYIPIPNIPSPASTDPGDSLLPALTLTRPRPCLALCSRLSQDETSRKMCDYTQVEYNCQHFRFVVLRWCPKYERTYKPCAPNVTRVELRHDEQCSDCRPRSLPPWEHMIRRKPKHSSYV
ncbi:hypothetical protein F4861DRAFT_297520 [Xylaria intraflava]|nr:hypothetical protein F4861DRAFT_297520 [Xylaria intraflava]